MNLIFLKKLILKLVEVFHNYQILHLTYYWTLKIRIFDLILYTSSLHDANRAPKTGVLKNGLITLWKLTPPDARNSQQLFWVKKCSTTLLQAKTGKHECRNVTATYICRYVSALILTCFCLKKGRATFFDLKQLLPVSCICWC